MPSFSRWPLDVRFLCGKVYDVWLRSIRDVDSQIRRGIDISTALPPSTDTLDKNEQVPPSAQHHQINEVAGKVGLENIDLGHGKLNAHVEKSLILLAEDTIHACTICAKPVLNNAISTLVCPNPACHAVYHMNCQARRFLETEPPADPILPTSGDCPRCRIALRWIDLVKEASWRVRGGARLSRLPKTPKPRKRKGSKAEQTLSSLQVATDNPPIAPPSPTIRTDSGGEHSDDAGLSDDGEDLLPPEWHQFEQDENDRASVASAVSDFSDGAESSNPANAKAKAKAKAARLEVVIEDSEAEEDGEL